MKIERRFEPVPAALERVAEILYQLLLETPPPGADASEPRDAAPCLSTDAEG